MTYVSFLSQLFQLFGDEDAQLNAQKVYDLCQAETLKKCVSLIEDSTLSGIKQRITNGISNEEAIRFITQHVRPENYERELSLVLATRLAPIIEEGKKSLNYDDFTKLQLLIKEVELNFPTIA